MWTACPKVYHRQLIPALAILYLFAQQGAPEANGAKPPLWKLHGESRYWFESRHNYSLGREPDLDTVLVRNRLILEVRPSSWLKFGGTFQDTRAPHYERPRPGTVQDPFDLHEAYVEINPDAKTGWNVLAGRKRITFADQNFIGLPEWVNSGRTYDTFQVNYKSSLGTARAMMLSQVQFNPSGFNSPQLRDRLTGLYFQGNHDYDLYYFRHDRINLPPTDSVGVRVAHKFGPWKLSAETVVQNAFGSVTYATRKIGWFDTTIKYEYASPGFDQLYPAGHNRFGHGDVLNFRNLHSIQSINRLPLGKSGRLTLMYTSNWLANRNKPVYYFGGSALPIPSGGYTSSFIGQEFAAYTTHQWKFFQLGLGIAQWVNGEPLEYATPGESLRYMYVHTGFVF